MTAIREPLPPALSAPRLDVDRIRRDFPILQTSVRGKPLVYLDNASTSQKPQAVIDAVSRFYSTLNANIHRGVHRLSELASLTYEAVRDKARGFLKAAAADEIVFVRGTTEALNLVAQAFARPRLQPGDEILVTTMEHHSNIVPWQLVCEQTGAVVRVAPINDAGEIRLDELEARLTPRTRIVAVAHASNVLGTVNPVRRIADLAHAVGATVVVDGAQSVPHLPVDVQALGCDFFACSGHKMLGPTGVGLLYGRLHLLESMPPWQGGGGMIARVSFEETTFAPVPARFEAGTPAIAEVAGFGAAIEYFDAVGLDAIRQYEDDLLAYAVFRLSAVPGVRLIGEPRDRVSVLSFVMDGVHPHDIGTVLDAEGIAIRAGHHCAQPLMQRFGVPSTARASLSLYNTRAEVDALVGGLGKVAEVFG